jgi:quercetin dioxygenase-like cupin family protein
MRTILKPGILALTIVGLFMGLLPAAAASGGPPRFTVGPYHFQSPSFKIDSKDATDVVMPTFTIAPGQSNGWHIHPGPGFVMVTQGTLTLYRFDGDSCTKSVYGPGEGFVEAPGQVHTARNEGTTALVGQATFIGVPVGQSFRTTVAAPTGANCP